jgi:hypothetical protein
MFAFLLSVLTPNHPLTLNSDRKERGEHVQQYANTQDFYGSVDADESGNLMFFHVPDGIIRPAIAYQHKMTFVKRSDKYKAIKNLGKNVRIKGSILKTPDFEILIVEEVEILQMEV